jgi:hypothetical protein
MSGPAPGRTSDHPLAEAADRAAAAAARRARVLAVQEDRLRRGVGATIADVAEAATYLDAARGRQNEARRRLVTVRLARAYRSVMGQDFLAAARRLSRLTLAADVRRTPLDSES